MTRIIGGDLGGRQLVTPKGSRTRPTSDRVREAVFSALAARAAIAQATVLDLYAGSGAYALEALSRGAERAILVDQDRAALAAIRASVAGLGLTSRVQVIPGVAATVVGRGPGGPPASLVFLDPPYAMPDAEVLDTVVSLAANGWLAEGAWLVVERDRRSPGTAWPDWAEVDARRTYGETVITYVLVGPDYRATR